MFSHTGLPEGATQRVSIENADPIVVEAMLEFCYMACVPTGCDLKGLLLLADQYQIDGLVGECCGRILETWSTESAVDTLVALLPLRERPQFNGLWQKLLKLSTNDQRNNAQFVDSLLAKLTSSSCKRKRIEH